MGHDKQQGDQRHKRSLGGMGEEAGNVRFQPLNAAGHGFHQGAGRLRRSCWTAFLQPAVEQSAYALFDLAGRGGGMLFHLTGQHSAHKGQDRHSACQGEHSSQIRSVDDESLASLGQQPGLEHNQHSDCHCQQHHDHQFAPHPGRFMEQPRFRALPVLRFGIVPGIHLTIHDGT